jgi:predicted metal-dependent peptidase
MGEIVIIGDTSGSMGNEVFGQIATEINEINEQVRPERVRVIWADDTNCAREEVFEQDEIVTLHPKGGGGTDMRKPLRYVEKFDPIVTILVTDGDTPWPRAEPDYPLIVLLTRRNTCPIGKVIEM